MTLSTLAIEKKTLKKISIIYFCLTLFFGLFSATYEHYSHGVYSIYMVFLFLIPLIGGVLPFAAIAHIHKLHYPGRLSINLWNSGIATLSVGSCLQGILEIYGASSDYMVVYWLLGTAFIGVGLISYLFTNTRFIK